MCETIRDAKASKFSTVVNKNNNNKSKLWIDVSCTSETEWLSIDLKRQEQPAVTIVLMHIQKPWLIPLLFLGLLA